MISSKLSEDLPQVSSHEPGGAAGQGLVEYALILVLVVIVVFIVVVWIGPWVGNVFSNVVSNL